MSTNDLTGRRFGMLTVLETASEKHGQYCVYRCRCDCGGEVFADTKRLERGTVTNCGCIPKAAARTGRIAEDLTGRRFGELTVLERAENRNGRTAWLCECSCGQLHTVTAHDLKSGHVKSCGSPHHRINQNYADIAGERFGRLTALYPTEERDKKGSVVWRCECDCGRKINLTHDNLVYGNYRSCGCLREEIKHGIHNQLHFIDGTCVEWLGGRRNRCDNTSGFRGVSKTKRGKYRASISLQNQRYNLGTYQTFEEAVSARRDAENLLHDGFISAYTEWNKMAQNVPGWAEENPFFFRVTCQGGELRCESVMDGCTVERKQANKR